MSSLKDETRIYKDELDQWCNTLGLSKYQPSNNELEKILEFTRETLRERSSTELCEDVVILAQFAMFLQQKMNESKTYIKWSGQVTSSLSGDDRPRLNRWVKLAELRIERIMYLTRRIEFMGQCISNLVRTRYNEGNNG